MTEPLFILIADPNPYVRSFLVREMAARGYRTAEAASGKEILAKLHGRPWPDLVVMELDFPVTIGLAVLEKVQNLIPTIPQIVYTHFTEYENHPSVKKADDFIEKNADPSELLHSISRVAARIMKLRTKPGARKPADGSSFFNQV